MPKMPKRMTTTKDFIVGWGRAPKTRKITFFIRHSKIKNGATIPTYPKDLEKRMVELATQIDGGRRKR